MNVFDQAVAFALKKHEGQTRKREDIPFILHPCEAATIAATLTNDRAILAAVVLHDTVEDTDATIDEIRENFGDRIADLVAGDTEPEYSGMSKIESWTLRKEASLKYLETTTDRGVKIMWLSDKLANMRSFYRQYLSEGDALWQNYHQKDKSRQEWYYRTIGQLLTDFEGTAAYQEYNQLLTAVFDGGYYENKHE